MTRTPQRTGLTIPICGSPLKEGEIPGEIKSPIGCAGSVQPKLAVDGANFGRFDQARVRHGDRVQRAFELFQPKVQKLIQLRKAGAEIVILPDIGLQQPRMIRRR